MTIGVIVRKSASRIAAGEFKAKCLQIMDQVKETHVPVIITKHGTPIAQLVPIETTPPLLFGLQKGAIIITGDIIAPLDEKWDVNA